jgi:predicted AAA+ superfamily ATPase
MKRERLVRSIREALLVNPVVAILGPRQSGKTTIAREFGVYPSLNYFDLEDPIDLARLDNPKLALSELKGLVIVDEIQRRPELFPILRVLVDRPNNTTRFLILGSASRDLIKQSSETLAGRISHIEVSPFSLGEVSSESIQNLWLRGGFPRSYLASSDRESIVWREEYIRTYLERDLPMLGIQIPSQAIRRFWMMLAHYHGQIFNASELGRSMQLSDTTVRRYLEILCSTFMVGTLQPWFENIAKRQVKTPKVFIRDSGILHSLIGIHSHDELHTNPKLGASWEGFALEEVRRAYHCRDQDCYFWAVHEQAELDLLIIKDGRRLGFEVKYTDSPKVTKSMKSALELLKLDSLTIVCPGAARFQLADQIAVCGIEVVYEAAASTA